jgi:hypothetical protein
LDFGHHFELWEMIIFYKVVFSFSDLDEFFIYFCFDFLEIFCILGLARKKLDWFFTNIIKNKYWSPKKFHEKPNNRYNFWTKWLRNMQNNILERSLTILFAKNKVGLFGLKNFIGWSKNEEKIPKLRRAVFFVVSSAMRYC